MGVADTIGARVGVCVGVSVAGPVGVRDCTGVGVEVAVGAGVLVATGVGVLAAVAVTADVAIGRCVGVDGVAGPLDAGAADASQTPTTRPARTPREMSANFDRPSTLNRSFLRRDAGGRRAWAFAYPEQRRAGFLVTGDRAALCAAPSL